MPFNSIEFGIFLPVVFLLYWFVFRQNIRVQNTFLLVASYFFYGWWDWRVLSLIILSSAVDYLVGLGLARSDDKHKRRLLLGISIFVNIGLLGFFKYFNFFAESFSDAFTLVGSTFEYSRLKIILPVGISFYTFQTLSYTIDVFNRKLKPTKDIIAFFAFVSFFPQLVAGPIERATNLLPQFFRKRTFEYNLASDGMRQILWGLFKKVVIADNCAVIVEMIFNDPVSYSGSTLVLGAIFFAFQIYGDFSGYSDIAIGTARLFGFDLMRNFAFPYFARDIAEFWRRWHISLSTWFRDYLYIPLGGSRGSTLSKVRNTFIVFLVSGFWHGANWTFLVWGALHALLFLPLLLLKKNRTHLNIVAAGRRLPNFRELFSILSTFILVVFCWIFFRADNIHHAVMYLSGICNRSLFSLPEIESSTTLLLIFVLVGIEWVGREGQFGIAFIQSWKKPLRWLFYIIVALSILRLAGEEQEFIYFQF